MATVLEDCWHGKISSREAEERLTAVNKTNAYLFRESDIKSKKFILSYISDRASGLFKHLIVPAPTRKGFPSVREAFTVMNKMVLASDYCRNPLPLSILIEKNDDDELDEPAHDLACYVCELLCENKEKLKLHVQVHSVVECKDCHKFIGKGSITSHIQKCKDLPRKVHTCDQCGYTTNWAKCIRDHKKRVHEEGRSQCDICKKVFDSHDKLLRHKEVHSGVDFPCPECSKPFKHLKSRNRHYSLHHTKIKTDCGFMKLEPAKLTIPVKKEPGFACTYEDCIKRFKERARLEKHVARAHVKVSSSTSSHRKTYECDSCPHVCYDSSNLRRHLQSHHLQHIVTVI